MSTTSLVNAPLLDAQTGNFVVAPNTGLVIWTCLALMLWVGVAATLGRAAALRGQSRSLVFATSLVLSPIIAFALLFLLSRRPVAHAG